MNKPEVVDPYRKLRYPEPGKTPDDEVCRCEGRPPLILLAALDPNVIRCLMCQGEVPPERIKLPLALADAIANRAQLALAVEALWLDSQEYEAWAQKELEDPTSPMNVRGREVRAGLEVVHRSYYWLHRDTEARGQTAKCPICGVQLRVYERGTRDALYVCDACSIVMP
jgi:hypothetical protein